MSKNVREFINAWDAAKGNEAARREIAEGIWYDWFCSDKALVRLDSILAKLGVYKA